MDEKLKRINKACEAFLLALNDADAIEDQRVFIALDAMASKWGRTIAAEQRGIQGTYIHFVRGT